MRKVFRTGRIRSRPQAEMLLVGPYRVSRLTGVRWLVLVRLVLIIPLLVSSQTPRRDDNDLDDVSMISAEQKVCVQTPTEFAEAFAKRVRIELDPRAP